jgi:phosphoglycerol transferase MdoB-like AlkP superfamily enzyme
MNDPALRQTARPWIQLLRPALVQVAVFVVLSGVLRGVLEGTFGSLLRMSWAEHVRLYVTGAYLDVMVGFLVMLPVALGGALVPERWWGRRWYRIFSRAGLALWWGVVLFVLQAEYYFFHEYASRFNTVAIDYLHYWTEVTQNIKEMYPVRRIVTLCVMGSGAVVFWMARWFPRPVSLTTRDRMRGCVGWLGGAALLVVGATQLPMQWSSERLANELTTNGLTAGGIALWTRDLKYRDFYPSLPEDEAYARARRLLDTPGAVWDKDSRSLQRRIPGDVGRPKKNLVLLLEESFGSDFWGALNGKKGTKDSLTPRLDGLVEEGLLFTSLFADGNRTIRGIEGVVASYPPVPGDSIVAKTMTEGCETLASVLRRDGYHTRFIYPGRGIFDGLGRFSLRNGFDSFTEQKDFKNPVFTNVWGHCDEDLYDRVIEEARLDYAAGKPFFITALSVSNHQPFTYPEGRISEPPYRRSRLHAVKYVDYALGRFFDRVKGEAFWKDTIFVVIADHGARVYGSETLPIRSYQIPFLVMGPAAGVGAGQNAVLGCQLDVAPTLLGLIGRPYDSVFFGRDLLLKELSEPRRAVLHHNRSIGIYRDERLIALSLNRLVEQFVGKPTDRLRRVPMDAEAEEISKDAQALIEVADDLYRKRRFRWKQVAE